MAITKPKGRRKPPSRGPRSKPPKGPNRGPSRNLRPYFTTKDGRKVWAEDYGHRAWPIGRSK